MTRMSMALAALVIVVFAGSSVSSEFNLSDDVEYVESLDSSTKCETNGWLIAEAELLFFGYYQEGGVTDRSGNPASFDWRLMPRVTVGYEGPDTLGVRGRYFAYDDQTNATPQSTVDVKAYYIDGEIYQDFQIGCRTHLEYFLGARYQDFEQLLTDSTSSVLARNQGFGGVIGLQARRDFLFGRWYARGRYCVCVGDAVITNSAGETVARFEATDTIFTSSELAVGYEVSHEVANWVLITARGGAEWQYWGNVAMADSNFGGLGNDDVMENAGFAGLTFSLGLEF